MAPKKKAAAASAPASRKKPAPLAPGKTHDGRPNRAEKRLVNKATKVAATELVNDIRVTIKDVGKEKVAEGPVLPAYNGWTVEVEKALYDLVGTGHSMREISAMQGMPRLIDMLTWLTDDTHPFSKIYMRAKQAVVALYEEEIQRIGMNAQRAKLRTERQQLTKDGDLVDTVETRYIDNVERSKLAVATLQWTLGHLKPKKHGRNPDQSTGSANEQLKGLFDALKAGPADAQK